MQGVDYGQFAPWVAVAGSLAAAVGAFRMIAFGRGVFDPKVELAPVLTRAAGIVVMIGAAIAFFSTRGSIALFPIAGWAIGAGVLLVIALLADLALRTGLTVRCENPKATVIGGFALTPRAKGILAGDTKFVVPGQTIPGSVSELFCHSPRKPDQVWEPASIALAHAAIALSFVLWIAAGVFGVAAASIVAEKALLIGAAG